MKIVTATLNIFVLLPTPVHPAVGRTSIILGNTTTTKNQDIKNVGNRIIDTRISIEHFFNILRSKIPGTNRK